MSKTRPWGAVLAVVLGCNQPSAIPPEPGEFQYPVPVSVGRLGADGLRAQDGDLVSEHSELFFDRCGMQLDIWELSLAPWLVQVEEDDWDYMHQERWADIEVDATLCFPGVAVPIGLEIQGASSRKLDKKNYKFKFNRGTELDGAVVETELTVDKLIVKSMALDRTMIREALAFDLWKQMGHDAPYVDFLNLQVNEQYHGLYALVEPVDKDYLRRRGLNDSGHLYKAVRKRGEVADFHPQMDVTQAFEDRTTPEQPDYGPLEELLELIQDRGVDGQEFAERLDAQLSLDAYLDRMIWISMTQNSDAVLQNFFLYYEPTSGGRPWTLIPWDSNIAFGAYWADPDQYLDPERYHLLTDYNVLTDRILETESLRERLVTRFEALFETVFSEENLQESFERMARRVRPDLRWEAARWGHPRKARPLDFIQGFMETRSARLKKVLAGFGDE